MAIFSTSLIIERELPANGDGLVLALKGSMDPPPKPKLLMFDLTGRVLGVFFDVYNELGPGFPEFVCRRALVIGLQCAGIRVDEEVAVPVWFRGAQIVRFRADLVIPAGPLLVEVKAVPSIEAFHQTQVLSYLKGTEIEVALILNFGDDRNSSALHSKTSARARCPAASSKSVEDQSASIRSRVAYRLVT